LRNIRKLDLKYLNKLDKLDVTEERKVAMDTFKYSITYLMVLFIVLLVDHYYPITLS